MGKFGWSLPAGCGTLPGEESEGPCQVCGAFDVDDCICPECPICTEIGNPDCYDEHGLERNLKQIEGKRAYEEYIKQMTSGEIYHKEEY